MKPIVDYIKECEAKQKSVVLDSDIALSSGFTMAGKKSKAVEKGYIVIKEKKIYDYLSELAKEDAGPREKIRSIQLQKWDEDDIVLGAYANFKEPNYFSFTCNSNIRWTGDKFVWQETLVEEYQEIPPAYVYQKLLKAKEHKIFDYFTVATIKKVKDPLLLGRINNDDNRYFIAQWDDDIQLDNLI